MKVIEIAFVAYPITDVARARKFYEGTLGLKQTDFSEGDNFVWIEYDIGPGTLGIGKSQGWAPSPHGGSAALEVEDFDAAIACLRADGVEFVREPMDLSDCRMAMIHDPDGNTITIHKRIK